jgi:hypothetical protein
MTKLFLMLGALAVASTLTAEANLGETKAQSIQHYGRIISVNAYGVCMWNVKGYWISEMFNDAGICEMIAYYKKNGILSKTEGDAFQHVNFPQVATDQGWIEQDVADNTDPQMHTHIWFTPDNVWRYENGNNKMGKYYFSSIVLGTVRASVELMRRIAASENTQEQPAQTVNSDVLPL